MKLLAENK